MHTTVLDLPTPHVIRTEAECAAAVAEIDRLLDLDPRRYTEEFDRLEVLSLLVEDYDVRNHPIDDSALRPQDAVGVMLEQKGLTRADLADVMGGRSRVADFFSGKRALSRTLIVALREKLGIPADLLM